MLRDAGDANPLASDLDGILESSAEAWSSLSGARIFITGGTGFVGTWLLESFAWANRVLSLDASAVVLTRDPERFAAKVPHLASDPGISLLQGDVTDFEAPAGPFTHVIHAAAESSTQQNATDPLRMIDTVVRGTRNVLDAARSWGSSGVLFTSSGAVYGVQPGDLELISEEQPGGPDPLAAGSAYPEAKRLAETLCATYAVQHGVPVKIARCFAFVGPHLPLDAHFAVGNFIRDGLAGGPISVRGDGTPVRSYLYAAELASWLWTILLAGESGRAYNVGSEHGHSIAEVARTVAAAFQSAPRVSIAGTRVENLGGGGDRYVPSTQRAREELGLRETVDLCEAVSRTIEWQRKRRRA
ncbi:MAG: NAD(P)-dependent oxidoreductase [Coriobacteriia bacterium]|nr:NAD(P)-dependent oxidoreductase [Coriobacteriia bacterium]